MNNATERVVYREEVTSQSNTIASIVTVVLALSLSSPSRQWNKEID